MKELLALKKDKKKNVWKASGVVKNMLGKSKLYSSFLKPKGGGNRR